MKKIGLISDTHGFLDDAVFEHFKDCDEVWHAGDFGSMEIIHQLKDFKPLRGVWGNIDDAAIRQRFPEQLEFSCEDVRVYMMHIGGYPKRYAPGVKNALIDHGAKLFISGHSHILKIIYDQEIDCLHMNPGAAGRQGWHQQRTVIRFEIAGNKMQNCEVIELGKK